MNIKQYYDELKVFDWYFEYSDDYRVYTKGRDNYNKLKGISGESEEHKQLFNAFKDYYFNNGNYPKNIDKALDKLLKNLGIGE